MDFEKLLEEAAGKKLAGKKKQLQSSYDQSLADLAELEQGAAQQAREAATRRTAEAKQDRAAWNEIQTAQGLTSGAQSQALLAMDNQLRGDLTAIANTRDSATAELARKRQALARDLAQQLQFNGRWCTLNQRPGGSRRSHQEWSERSFPEHPRFPDRWLPPRKQCFRRDVRR